MEIVLKIENLTCFLTWNKWFKGKGYTLMGYNSVKAVFPPFEMGSILKGNDLLPRGSKFFSFRVEPFPQGTAVHEREQELTVVSLVRWQKYFKYLLYIITY